MNNVITKDVLWVFVLIFLGLAELLYVYYAKRKGKIFSLWFLGFKTLKKEENPFKFQTICNIYIMGGFALIIIGIVLLIYQLIK